VGSMVGNSVGDPVGAVVGDSVGVLVGDSVGGLRSVGDSVGDLVSGQIPHDLEQINFNSTLPSLPYEYFFEHALN